MTFIFMAYSNMYPHTEKQDLEIMKDEDSEDEDEE